MRGLRMRPGRLDRSTWLFVLLLLVVLVPAGVLLWFMNEAVVAQSAAARQSVLEAYRGQLRLVRSKIDSYWERYAATLHAGTDPEVQFARLILGEGADGVVLLNPDGTVAYPHATGPAAGSPPSPVDDPAQHLLGIELLAASDDRRARRIAQLAAILNDYSAAMPSPRRLSLMGELRLLDRNVALPTEAALRLSTQMVDAGAPAAEAGGFRRTPLPDVWALTSADRQAIGLYRTGRIEALMHDMLHQVTPEGIRFIALPPGEPGDAEAIAAGPSLPGWQLTFVPIDPAPFDDAARRRVIWHVWVGGAGLVVMAALGVTAAGALRRQLRLARLKTDLVAAVSHELRTPLTSMRVLVDGLLADAALEPSKTREYLQMMATENARLSRLIENFLTFSRLERDRRHLVFGVTHPAAIVHAAVDAIHHRIPDGCELDVEVAPDLPALVADADALGTALVNLLDNALKYTPADKQIRVAVHRDNEFVAFAVRDNGIGIPEREQRRIFRRFYRVDQRLASETSGVGLGLSIVELIVLAHGGTISVRSGAGSGSTFTLRVPCAAEGAAV